MAKIGGDGLEGAPGPSPLPRGPKFWCEKCERWVSYYIEKRGELTGGSMYVYDPDKARGEHSATHKTAEREAVADVFAGHPDLLALDVELREWYE